MMAMWLWWKESLRDDSRRGRERDERKEVDMVCIGERLERMGA